MTNKERIEEMGMTMALLEADLLAVNKRLVEKDLEIKKLQTEIEEYEIALDLAAKSNGNHAKITLSATADNERLRRALEETVRIYETSDMESDFADILEEMYTTCKTALGEGDKQ